nr:hypothetical protein [uncultured Desulfobulbus sp.]
MMKRYLLSLLCIPLLPALYCLLLLPLYGLRHTFSALHFEQLLCLWGAAALLTMLLIGNTLLGKIWCFRGADKLTSENQLRDALLAVNAMDCPVLAKGKRKKVVFTWRYKQLQWCGMFSRLGMTRLYELRCRIDADHRTVYLVDRTRMVDFLICPDRVKTGFARICLPWLRAGSSNLKTIDAYASLAPHDYDFHPREVKSPVMGTIIKCGWNVRFSLF